MRYLLKTAIIAGLLASSCATLPMLPRRANWVRNDPLIMEEEEGNFIIRVEAFTNEDKTIAENKVRELKVLLNDNLYLIFEAPKWKVLVGDFTSKYSADKLKRELQSFGYTDARVVSLKVEE